MKNITASIVNMYHICKREMWLHAHHINMEQDSDLVYEGKLIGETTYMERSSQSKEIELNLVWEGISLHGKIDFFDSSKKIVYETKKSNKLETAHIGQVKFYLFLLWNSGIENVSGKIEYPKLRQTQQIKALTDEDINIIGAWIKDIDFIINQDECPPVIHKQFCKTCSYFEFCYV